MYAGGRGNVVSHQLPIEANATSIRRRCYCRRHADSFKAIDGHQEIVDNMHVVDMIEYRLMANVSWRA